MDGRIDGWTGLLSVHQSNTCVRFGTMRWNNTCVGWWFESSVMVMSGCGGGVSVEEKQQGRVWLCVDVFNPLSYVGAGERGGS